MNQKFVETTRCEIEIEVGLDRMQQNFEILFFTLATISNFWLCFRLTLNAHVFQLIYQVPSLIKSLHSLSVCLSACLSLSLSLSLSHAYTHIVFPH